MMRPRVLAASRLLALGVLATSANAFARPLDAQVVEAQSTAPAVAYVAPMRLPRLVDVTPAKVVLDGPLGLLIADAVDGVDPIADYNIQNPSADMARRLAGSFADRLAGRVLLDPVVDSGKIGDDAKRLAAASVGAQFVVQVDTPSMTLIYSPLHWNRFDLAYSSRAQVVRVDDHAVVARARCQVRRVYASDELDHRQLLADGASALKRLIQEKSEACLSQLAGQMNLSTIGLVEPRSPAIAAAAQRAAYAAPATAASPPRAVLAAATTPLVILAAPAAAEPVLPSVTSTLRAAGPPPPSAILATADAPPPVATAPRPPSVVELRGANPARPSEAGAASQAVATAAAAPPRPAASAAERAGVYTPYVGAARPVAPGAVEQGRVLELRLLADGTVQELRAAPSP